jgi:predicted transcriptional regulator
VKAIKTATITVRIKPAVKSELKAIAECERRSLVKMIEVMIRDYCGRNPVPIDESTNNSSAIKK